MAFENIPLGATTWREIINLNFARAYTKSDIDTKESNINSRIDDVETEIYAPTADVEFQADNVGTILIDRDDGKKYRLFVNAGALAIEEVV